VVLAPAQAAGRGGHGGHSGGHSGHSGSHTGSHSSSSHMPHGMKSYQGKYHKHWSHYGYSKSYGCYLYYDPCCCSYYYYCQPACCYYPVSYCPYQTYCWNAPAYCTPSTPQVAVNVNNSANAASGGSTV